MKLYQGNARNHLSVYLRRYHVQDRISICIAVGAMLLMAVR